MRCLKIVSASSHRINRHLIERTINLDNKTNFQRIKEMSAEELAIFISYVAESDNMMLESTSEILAKREDEKPQNFDSVRFWLEGQSY